IGFCTMMFTHEPPGPSRRVRIHWQRSGAGALRRFFGPGLTKTSVLVMLFGVLGTTAIALVTMLAIEAFGTSSEKHTKALQVFVFAAYATPFFVFVVGLNTWLRARGNSPWIARLISGGVLFLIAAGPWVVAAIGGVLARTDEKDWLIVGSPSPFYAFVMLGALDSAHTDRFPIPAGLACATGWGALGLILLAAAGRRCARTVAQHDAAVAQAEAALDAEEAAKRSATAQQAAPDTVPMPRTT